MIKNILENMKICKPIVHCLTNYVTVNDCANVILAIGGSPIMADSNLEVEEITSISNSLVINLGTLDNQTVESMIIAGKKANELGHPVILDPVGAGASKLRTETTFKLMKEVQFSVIRGNSSEIKTVYFGSGKTKGVDVSEEDVISETTLQSAIQLAKRLSRKTGVVICMTGETDIISDGEKTYIVKNGHPMMSSITGTGCMLTSIVGGYCGANPESILDATMISAGSMGLCGQKAAQKVISLGLGTGSFRIALIDEISLLTLESLKEGLQYEVL